MDAAVKGHKTGVILNNKQTETKPSVSWGYKHNGYYLLKILFTVAGFIIAIVTNITFPQKAAVEIKDYIINAAGLSIKLTMNDAYIFVLAALTVIYLISGITAWKDTDKRRKYSKDAAFRFALGIALALWDIGGTKMQFFETIFYFLSC